MIFAQEIIENSIFISTLRKSKIVYCHAKRWLDEIYKYSLTNKLIHTFLERVKVNFQYSFFNRITQKDYTGNKLILDNSKIVRKLLNIYSGGINRITNCLKTSIFKNSITAIMQESYFSSPRIVGVILLSSVLANIFFSILLNKETGFWGWMVKLILLFLGIGSLYSDVDYKKVIETSFFIRYINNHCKI